jgi:hypothetical protein
LVFIDAPSEKAIEVSLHWDIIRADPKNGYRHGVVPSQSPFFRSAPKLEAGRCKNPF